MSLWPDIFAVGNHGSVRFIEDRVINIPGLEEKIARPIDDRLIWQNIGHSRFD
jgi:hypothetical protein